MPNQQLKSLNERCDSAHELSPRSNPRVREGQTYMTQAKSYPAALRWAALLLATAFFGCLTSVPVSSSAQTAGSQPAKLQKAATDVYVYGYPLVTMELTRRAFTNVAAASPWICMCRAGSENCHEKPRSGFTEASRRR